MRVAAFAFVFLLAGSARADESLDACSAAAVDGQKLERSGKMLEAKGRYEACALAQCRADIAQDCRGWLAQLDRKTPSIVVDARDDQGRPVDDAAVAIDGVTVAPDALAKAIRLDPGTHTVTFDRGVRVVRTVNLREGERADVSVMFAPRAAKPNPVPEKRPIPTTVYVTGGIALAAFATFGIAAGIGYADYQGTTCDVRCGHDDASRVETKLLVADVALAVGVVASLVTGGLYLFR